MKKITFIGASGAGKSTFYKSLLNARTKLDQWSSPEEERLKIAKAEKWDFMKLNYRNFMLFCLKTGLFKNSHSIFVRDLLSKKEKNALLNYTGAYEGLMELMFRYCSEHNREPASKRMRLVSFYLDTLLKQVLVLESTGCKKTVVFDDGIFHNNEGLATPNSLEQIMQKYPEMVEVTNPMAIIYCKISQEENVARIKNRVKNGRGTFLEVGMDDASLEAISNELIESSRIKVEQFRQVGVPVLEIEMAGPMKENIQKTLEFIRKFI